MKRALRILAVAAVLPATIFLAGCSALGEKPVAVATMPADTYYQTALDASVAAVQKTGHTEIFQIDGAPTQTSFFDATGEGDYKYLVVDDAKGTVTPSKEKGAQFLDALVLAKATPEKAGENIIVSANYAGESATWTLTVQNGVITGATGKGSAHTYALALVYEVTAGGKALLTASNAATK